MKTLSVIRHAKAETPEEFARDFDRPLALRGHKDAARIAKRLKSVKPPVDWIVTSPAVRAEETAQDVATVLDNQPELFLDEEVYGADANRLLARVGKIPVESEHAVLIGHNPAICELISGLCAGSPTRLNLHVATGALAHFRLEIFRWDQVRWGCGQLRFLLTPKSLKK